ncbi:MAG: phosphoribosylamine--glycine ligase [Bacteroidales bacterium]|nr:phosphoribosylamine--glycine ligase [Bacteroidales bacterium]MBD5284104.1 phosphoribosylamine--glycine ligase [Bacteroides sp.]
MIEDKKVKRVLVIGSGGREHAIVDALARSSRVAKIFCAPGNAGIADKAECVDISVTDIDDLARFAKDNNIDLTVVGPEAALAEGVADRFAEDGLAIFGPTREAARIESSKEFAKEIMERHGIPTASYRAFDNFDEALAYVKSRPLPAVVKYDGLAAGKGVVVAPTYEEAEAALRDMLLGAAFGKGRVVIEDFLAGPEFSFMCIVSGRKVYPLAIAQDHKRAYDNDEGPNTGGMGAYSPVPFVTDEIREKALKEVMQKTADALADEGIHYCGVLYGGLILTAEGPKVIEFNARFGDPETEVVLPRLKTDIYTLFESAVAGVDCPTSWNPETCLGVVLAAEGYPGKYAKGIEIEGTDKVSGDVLHMGTARKEGKLVSAGGRVMMITATGGNVAEARDRVMADIRKINAPGLFWRTDIGHQSI